MGVFREGCGHEKLCGFSDGVGLEGVQQKG